MYPITPVVEGLLAIGNSRELNSKEVQLLDTFIHSTKATFISEVSKVLIRRLPEFYQNSFNIIQYYSILFTCVII